MLAPPEREDFSRRGGAFLRLAGVLRLRFFRVVRTSAQRGLSLSRRAHTRGLLGKPHTAATRASRRAADVRHTHRVGRVDFFHRRKIGTFGTLEGNPPFAVAAVRLS